MPIVIITRNHAFCKQAKEISIIARQGIGRKFQKPTVFEA